MSSCLGPVGNHSWLAPGWLRFNLIFLLVCPLQSYLMIFFTWWYCPDRPQDSLGTDWSSERRGFPPDWVIIICDKVNRCLARYSPRATTTNQMSRQGLAQNEQKCHFRAKFGLFWAKNPNFYWRNQKFCHPHTENPPRHLVHIGFWSDIGQNVQKMAIFGPKWPKMQIFDQIWPFLGQKS